MTDNTDHPRAVYASIDFFFVFAIIFVVFVVAVGAVDLDSPTQASNVVRVLAAAVLLRAAGLWIKLNRERAEVTRQTNAGDACDRRDIQLAARHMTSTFGWLALYGSVGLGCAYWGESLRAEPDLLSWLLRFNGAMMSLMVLFSAIATWRAAVMARRLLDTQ